MQISIEAIIRREDSCEIIKTRRPTNNYPWRWRRFLGWP